MSCSLLSTPAAGDRSLRASGRPLAALLLCVVALLLLGTPGRGEAQAPPDEDWRTLETPHFRVHFPARTEALARRAAERGERAWALLSELFLEPVGGKVDLVVTDHVDGSNGMAGVTPWRRIVVFAAPPVDGGGLSYFDDWMELVVTHELAHIFHLDVAGRGGRGLRAIMGRAPGAWPLFPNRGLPTWIIEGLAVHYESALTDAGRVRGTFHEMVVRTAALDGGLETLDQIGGRSPVWPAGQRPYIYGSLFFHDLVVRSGPGSVARFVREVGAQWVPYRIDAASRRAFGAPFSELYEVWREQTGREALALADSLGEVRPFTLGEPLTRGARTAIHPQWAPDGRLAYARSDGRSDSQIRILEPGGLEAGEQVAEESRAGESREGDSVAGRSGRGDWIRTNGLASFSWLPDGGLLISQLEARGPYRLYGDLTLRTPAGREERLTDGARLSSPHVRAGGRLAVAVQDGGGTNRLVLVGIPEGGIRPLGDFTLDEHWAHPRWSPDGEWIVASRWRPGARLDVVLLRPDGEVVWTVTDDRAVDTTPTWSPDGRWLLWSSDRTGISNLFAVEIDPASGRPGPVRQVTHVLEGAAHPAVDPTGEWLVYSRYGATGWDLERIPFAPSAFFEPFATDPRFLAGGERAAERYTAALDSPHRPYRPLRSALPRWWSPLFSEAETVRGVEVVGPRYGLSVEGRDLVDRHGWAGELLLDPADGRWEGAMGWRWAGLGVPVLGMSAAQQWDGAGGLLGRRMVEGVEVVDTLYLAERERSLGATATFVRARARSTSMLTLGARGIRQNLVLQDALGAPPPGYRLGRPDRSLGEIRTGLSVSTLRRYSFSDGVEDGVALAVQGRRRWDPGLADSLQGVPGADQGFGEWTGAVRLYQGLAGPGYSRWVVALRGAGGVGSGPGAGAFFFDLGGASGQPEGITGLGTFGGGALLFPVRGYAEGIRSGRYAWAGSAELRFPVTLIHRGIGPALLHFDRLSGGVFFDAGNAWGNTPGASSPNGAAEALRSAGGEIVLRLTPLWLSTLDFRGGVAFPLVESGDPVFYLRLGRSF